MQRWQQGLMALGMGLCVGAHAQVSVPAKVPTSSTWTVALTGDVMLGTDYPSAQLPPREGQGLLDEAAPVLQAAQVSIGNLEGTVGEGGTTAKTACGRCFVFRTPPSIAPRLKEAGFTAFNMANNHAHDFGDAGLVQTRAVLDRLGLAHAGAANRPWATLTVGTRQACLLGFAPNQGMNDLRDIPGAARQVAQAKAVCGLVIVAFHGGAEGADQTHTPIGVQTYLGENRGDVRAFAHAMVDAGADLVFGQGPHVVRGLELRQGHLIAYSLGNFMTYGGISVAGVPGWSVVLSVTLDDQGRLASGQLHSFVQTFHGPLRVDPAHQAARLMAQRTQDDFSGGQLRFTESGQFAPQATPDAAVAER